MNLCCSCPFRLASCKFPQVKPEHGLSASVPRSTYAELCWLIPLKMGEGLFYPWGGRVLFHLFYSET